MNFVYVHSTLPEDHYRVHIRCHNPAAALQNSGAHTVNLLPLENFIHNTTQAQRVCQPADVIILHRYLYEASLASIARWRARGKRIFVEIDAAFDHIEPDRTGYDFWKQGILPASLKNGRQVISPPPLDQLKWLLKIVDAVIVPTPSLAHDLFPFGRIVMLPDYLNINEYLVVRPPRKENIIRVGVNCTGTSPSSLRASGVLEGLRQASSQCEYLHVLLAGVTDNLGDLFADLPAGRKQVLPPIRQMELPGALAGLDIALAPAAGEFERRQSPLRLLEYMAMKIPWIASNLHCYQPMASFGILIENDPAVWADAILLLADQIDAAQRQAGSEAYLYALSQDAGENLEKIVRVFQSAGEEVNG
ncbi:MAG: glycosyltransferase [Chloroflexota bacterium]